MWLSSIKEHTVSLHCSKSAIRIPKTDFPWKMEGRSKLKMAFLWASLVAQMVKNPSAMQETCVQSLGWEDPLEKEVATHSKILAKRILRTKEPGGLQSMGSQRVWHDGTCHEWTTTKTFCDDFFFQSLKPKKYVNILLSLYGDYGLPQCSVVKNPPAMQETWETGFHPWVRKIPLEEGMATHSSVLAWRIPWTEEPGGLQSMGTHGVRHNWSNLAHIWLLCLSKCSGYLRGYGGQ